MSIVTFKFRIKDAAASKHLARYEARALGLTRYSPEKPCRRGHNAERFVANGTCVECSVVHTANAVRDPAKKAQRNARYFAAHANEVLSANAAWRDDNDTRMKALRRAHYRANKGAYNARARLREAHIKRATPPWVDRNAIIAIYREAARLTAQTGIPHEVDHIIPLRGRGVCGLHVPWNLRVVPAEVNRQKGNRIVPVAVARTIAM